MPGFKYTLWHMHKHYCLEALEIERNVIITICSLNGEGTYITKCKMQSITSFYPHQSSFSVTSNGWDYDGWSGFHCYLETSFFAIIVVVVAH